MDSETITASDVPAVNGSVTAIGLTGSVKVIDLVPVLEKKLAFVSGARERKHPVLTVPVCGVKSLESKDGSKDLSTTIDCLTAQINPEALAMGLIVVIDGRHVSNALCKCLLEHVALHWYCNIHHVYLIRLTSPLRKNITSDVVINHKVKVTYCYDEESLKRLIMPENLTDEFGGTLHYEHNHWIYIKTNFEKILIQWDKTKDELPGMRTGLACAQLVHTVKEAEKQMFEHLKLKEIICNKICDSSEATENFLSFLRHPDMKYISMACTPDYVELTEKLLLLKNKIDEEQRQFDQFWSQHKTLLDRVMNFALFDRSVNRVKGLVEGYLEDLTTDLVVGDNLTTATHLGEQHEAFTRKCMETVSGHLRSVKEESQLLCQPINVSSEEFTYQDMNLKEMSQTVKQNMTTLKELNKTLMTRCQQKRDLLMVAVKYHYLFAQCESWCKEGVDLLASQSVNDSDNKGAVAAIQKLNNLSKKFSMKQVTALKQMSSCLPEKNFKKSTSKLTDRCKQVNDMLEARKACYLKVIAATMKPPARPDKSESIQPVQSTQPVQTNQLEQQAKPVQPVQPVVQANQQLQSTRSSRSALSLSPTPVNKFNSPRHSVPTVCNGITNGMIGSQSSDKLDHYDGHTLTPTQQVYEELVASERVYVKDLASVMEGYYKEMEPNNMQVVPLKLRGKRQVVFGNLDEIYEFHNSVFLQELEEYHNSPEEVGQCFLKNSKSFRLYETYCKNRSKSNSLLQDDPVCEAFFKEIQLKLGHDLPFSSYLLKPVQRITKYQLLLKELMDKCVDSEPVFLNLKSAFDEMIKILRFLNQSMDVVGLKGFPGNLVDQGRLLAQEKFHIIESTSKASLHMFSRSKERQVFLFEKVLVLTKKATNRVSDSKKPGATSFLYKEHYFMTDISLRELDDQKMCLHLTVFGQNKPVILQAPSQQVKDAWETEIHRLLELQFSLLKEQALMSPTKENEMTVSGPFTSTLKRQSSLAQFQPPTNTVKPLIQSPTTSGQSESTELSDIDDSDGEVGFYSDDDDFNDDDDDLNDDDDGENLWEASNPASDEDNITYESLAPGAHKWYKATSDYAPGTTDNDVALVEDQIVELLGVSQVGWWWVRATNHDNIVQQGWVPASYLQMCSN